MNNEVTRYQHIPPSLEQEAQAYINGNLGWDAPQNQSTKVHTGSVQYTAGQDEPVQSNYASSVISHEGTSGGSIMATHDRLGKSVELIPGNPASRTSIAVAIRSGVIREVTPGVYEDVKTSTGEQRTMEHNFVEEHREQERQQEEQQREAAVDSEGVFNAEEDRAWVADMADVPAHAFNAAAASAVTAVVTGQDLSRAVERLAKDGAMSPAKAADLVESGVWAQKQIIGRAIAKVGVTGDQQEAFYEACKENPGKLQNAIHYLLHGRDVSQFQSMAREWLGKTERVSRGENDKSAAARNAGDPRSQHQETEEALRKAGMETTVDGKGNLLVKRGAMGKWVRVQDL